MSSDFFYFFCHRALEYGSILNSVMTDIPSAPIGDFENTLRFPSEETSLDSGLPSHLLLGDVPCPSSPPYGFLHHTIGALNYASCFHAITEIRMLTWNMRILRLLCSYINLFFYNYFWFFSHLVGKSLDDFK